MVFALEYLFIPKQKYTEKQVLANRIEEFHSTLLLTQAYNSKVNDEEKVTLDTLIEYFELSFDDILKPKGNTCLSRNPLKKQTSART